MMNGNGHKNGKKGGARSAAAEEKGVAQAAATPGRRTRFFSRHRYTRNVLIVIVIVVGLVVGIVVDTSVKTAQRQNALAPFYDTSGLHLAGPLGQVVRSQPLGVHVDNGTGLRI